MNRCERPGMLVFVQVDHLSGELLGDALEQLPSAGATNVQLLPTITKKGRPGQILLIDVAGDDLPNLEEFLVSELGATGWHRLPTQHVHVRTEIIAFPLTVHTAAGPLRAQVRGKLLKEREGPVRPEHSCCVSLRKRLREEYGLDVPLREVVRLVSGALNNGNGNRPEIDLRAAGACETERNQRLGQP